MLDQISVILDKKGLDCAIIILTQCTLSVVHNRGIEMENICFPSPKHKIVDCSPQFYSRIVHGRVSSGLSFSSRPSLSTCSYAIEALKT